MRFLRPIEAALLTIAGNLSVHATANLTCTAPGGFTVSASTTSTGGNYANASCILPAPPLNLAPGTVPTSPSATKFGIQEVIGFSGNTLTANDLAEGLNLASYTYTSPGIETITASWDNVIPLPSSKLGDVYFVSTYIGGGGGNLGQYDPGNSGLISIGSLNYTTKDDIRFGTPRQTTLPAAGISTLEEKGTFEFSWVEPGNRNASGGLNPSDDNLATEVTVSRFLADGVTPDPFSTPTPEPSTTALAMIGLIGLVCLGKSKMSAETSLAYDLR